MDARLAAPLADQHGARTDVTISGHFGRIFPLGSSGLQAYWASDDDLAALAATMVEPDIDPPDVSPFSNPYTSSGYTYFGQFVDHDLTNDPTALSSKVLSDGDLANIGDARSPVFDLDSMYGKGPSQETFYDGLKFKNPENKNGVLDLPRNDDGSAQIGDVRNDENLIVSQIHQAFLRFHNEVITELAANNKTLAPRDLFIQARQTVVNHYQWIVLHDFLPRLIGGDNLDAADILIEEVRRGARVFKPNGSFLMPVEYSGAAYRFGHSMVRFNYVLQDGTTPPERVIFDITGKQPDLQGRRPLPKDAEIQWKHFFPIDPNVKCQGAMRMDVGLSRGLSKLPTSVPGIDASLSEDDPRRSLAFRNLKRGVHYGLPSGQDLAGAYGIPVIDPVEVRNPTTSDGDGSPYVLGDRNGVLSDKFAHDTPAWYYMLFEAQNVGLKPPYTLGPLASRIITECFLAFLESDSTSILQTNWNPSAGRFGVPSQGRYQLSDLITYASS